MKIYIVASPLSIFKKELSNLRLLRSYFSTRKIIKEPPVIDYFLDSGAYSSFSQGKPIDIDAYAEFVKKYKNEIDVYANLDAIGDPQQTQRNQEYLESLGLHPLPVYHYGEPLKILEKLLDKYSYIALGGMVPIATNPLQMWLDYIWEFLSDKDGKPLVKVHGFGMTIRRLITRYAWFSIDSTSPIINAAMGVIYTKDGNCDLSRNRGIIPEATKIFIKEQFPKHSLKELRDDYKIRTIYNIEFMQKLEKQLTDNPPNFINSQLRLL